MTRSTARRSARKASASSRRPAARVRRSAVESVRTGPASRPAPVRPPPPHSARVALVLGAAALERCPASVAAAPRARWCAFSFLLASTAPTSRPATAVRSAGRDKSVWRPARAAPKVPPTPVSRLARIPSSERPPAKPGSFGSGSQSARSCQGAAAAQVEIVTREFADTAYSLQASTVSPSGASAPAGCRVSRAAS